MINDAYIEQNRTHVFYKGDKVIMQNCLEAEVEKYKNKVWTCRTDSFLDNSKQEVVFLEGFAGYFLGLYLKKIDQ